MLILDYTTKAKPFVVYGIIGGPPAGREPIAPSFRYNN